MTANPEGMEPVSDLLARIEVEISMYGYGSDQPQRILREAAAQLVALQAQVAERDRQIAAAEAAETDAKDLLWALYQPLIEWVAAREAVATESPADVRTNAKFGEKLNRLAEAEHALTIASRTPPAESELSTLRARVSELEEGLATMTDPAYLTEALTKVGAVDAEWQARAEAAEADNLRLRQIISECATATGAGVAPIATIGFMAKLPGEIASNREADAARIKELEEALRPFAGGGVDVSGQAAILERGVDVREALRRARSLAGEKQ